MTKQLLLIAAVALGLSACNEDSSPTGIGRDLLNNGNNVPSMSSSKYGQVEGAAVGVEEEPVDPERPYHIATGPSATIYTIKPQYHVATGADATRYELVPPGSFHITSGPRRSEYAKDGELRFHVTDGPSASIYTIKPQYHIASGANATNYERVLPSIRDWYHITSGPRRSDYAQNGDLRFHITDGPSVSIYTIKPQYHIPSGENATRYERVPQPEPVGEPEPAP